MRKDKGFTLIELLIVIGIIAILAAAVIIAINPGRQFEQARNASRWSHLNSIVNVIYAETVDQDGVFPECLTDRDDEEWVDASVCDEGETDGIDGFTAPRDPQAGDEDDSCYAIKLDGNTLTVAPASEDAGIDSGDEVICDIGDNVEGISVTQ